MDASENHRSADGQITPLSGADRPRWNELWQEYQRFYAVSLPAAVTEATWTRIQTGRIHGLGARTTAHHLVGIAHCLFHDDSWSTAPACYLQDLFVDPAHRHGGYGRRMIEAIAAFARSQGAGAPYWLTHESNRAARKLYDQVAQNHGFLQYVYADART
jgi:GNAT superfamily N-acetyltransferase